MVPANAHADGTEFGFSDGKPGITRGEIKFLVVMRVVWNVHLAIEPDLCAVAVEDQCGVVV